MAPQITEAVHKIKKIKKNKTTCLYDENQDYYLNMSYK